MLVYIRDFGVLLISQPFLQLPDINIVKYIFNAFLDENKILVVFNYIVDPRTFINKLSFKILFKLFITHRDIVSFY